MSNTLSMERKATKKKLSELLDIELNSVSERYNVIARRQHFLLYDDSLNEFIFETSKYSEMKSFISGIVLGRNTVG